MKLPVGEKMLDLFFLGHIEQYENKDEKGAESLYRDALALHKVDFGCGPSNALVSLT